MDILDVHIGIVGAGSFAAFAAQAFLTIPGIKIIAVSDINQHAAAALARHFTLQVFNDFETMLSEEKIDLIYIATPPYLHYQQSKMALRAGKHVICEKPAALKTSDAEELVGLARSMQLLYVVNLMQRYNPLFEKIKTVIQDQILGEFLHGFFENYASDENLNPDHWFWDSSKSGGIFIEHGVHFFDLFEGWLGEGQVVGAWQLPRPGCKKQIIDRVQATVLYKNGLVNFYHGFDQPIILDRQEMRLEFERGEITLYEWVPVKMKLHALLKEDQLQKLVEIFGDIKIINQNKAKPSNNIAKGRFKQLIWEDHITFEYENIAGKQGLYQEMLRAMVSDQILWMNTPDHVRIIDENNALQSLRMAEVANRTAII